jgi:hypothetical protein
MTIISHVRGAIMANVNNLPFIQNSGAHGAPEEIFTQANNKQTDIPHLIDFAFRTGQTSKELPPLVRDSSYLASNELQATNSCELPVGSSNDIYVDQMTICPEPFGLCSGSHRVVVTGMYRNIPFTVSIEEMEIANSPTCGYRGEFVTMAFGDGLCLSEPFKFLSALVPELIGVRLVYNTVNRGNNWRDRFLFEFTNHDKIISQGCELSEEASDCMWY